MDKEKLTFYGGPMDGQSRDLPAGLTRYPVQVALRLDKVSGVRRGEYTRVHDNSGRTTTDLEWIGYTSPFTANVVES